MEFSGQSIDHSMKRLWRHINRRRRLQFALLLILICLGSFAEIISIGAVLPFLTILASPSRVFDLPAAQPLISYFNIKSPDQLLAPLSIIFGVAVILTGFMRMVLLWASTRLSFAAGADLSNGIYRRTLYQPYSTHIARNSSEIINGISNKADVVINSIIMPILTLLNSVVVLVFILTALLFVDPRVAIAAFGGFGIIYVLIIQTTRKRLLENSKTISRESNHVFKSLQEGLGGIRDVLIDGSQEVFCQVYRSADERLRMAQGNNLFISHSPRYGMEALGIVLIICLAYVMSKSADGADAAIPILGALALGAQRLLPALQQAYGAWSNIKGGQVSLDDTLDLLDQPLPAYSDQVEVSPLKFENSIVMHGISFRYTEDTPWVIQEIDLEVKKGSRIGFIGETGSGKSTLIDIAMGLLLPTKGQLLVDGVLITEVNARNWQPHIAHVPQAIYLADSSIAENIAFGLRKEDIDYHRVIEAARQAQISDIIEKLPNKYQTLVGERGVRLSGGQRQRIGIARALYKKANVIIFDEATSALDGGTEEAVMQAIEGLSKDLTIFIIAHRLTTLKKCDRIIELKNSKISNVSTYASLVSQISTTEKTNER
ncbi:ABC transporter ATP-binding protein [Polynucleobacter sp. MG-28-Ekke-A2]|uniref:ABC transporter ATP-binding protein n=1 Tax=Polynucleobacter sp. MG-28-Ekke-A2 TaxID=3108276 RepID=UPI002B227027|nr:ABC transporter ATP-binding protein [Polynucleobacter sp. MG-28-Ekke-A2]MEA9601103.1 ABC transporter ATP-binding protein [Polynucleobacter sp. MG-28-Ekke-A2]